MKSNQLKPVGLAVALAIALFGVASTASAHGTGMMSGPMMEYDGSDMRNWQSHGYGMGAGMGYGMGYGSMMGPGMMGPGMMGSGMMYGYGGMGPALGLSSDQQQKMLQIHQELHEKNWALMGKMYDESAKLRQMFFSDHRDPKAIGEQQQRVFDLQRQMTEAWIDAQNRTEAILTDEQKEKLKQSGWPGMMGW